MGSSHSAPEAPIKKDSGNTGVNLHQELIAHISENKNNTNTTNLLLIILVVILAVVILILILIKYKNKLRKKMLKRARSELILKSIKVENTTE